MVAYRKVDVLQFPPTVPYLMAAAQASYYAVCQLLQKLFPTMQYI